MEDLKLKAILTGQKARVWMAMRINLKSCEMCTLLTSGLCLGIFCKKYLTGKSCWIKSLTQNWKERRSSREMLELD